MKNSVRWETTLPLTTTLIAINTILIAETTKSMKGRLSKLKPVILQNGFEIYNEEEKGDFTFLERREL
jgi:hypothetical protein